MERLGLIRSTMHNTCFSFGQNKMKLDRQGIPGQAFSENTRWSKAGVYFVGINMPGSNNNKVNPGTCLGSKTKRTQADPGFDWPETESVNERATLPDIDGFTDFLNLIVAQSVNFDGEIILVHGDTYFFKIDKPLLAPLSLIPNITRVQTFGEGKVHWVGAKVNPNGRNVFTFEPMMVPGN
jgi:hypothetical protein